MGSSSSDFTIQEQMALVWTLRSQARVGSYQHEVSSGPWIVLRGEEVALEAVTRAREISLQPAEICRF